MCAKGFFDPRWASTGRFASSIASGRRWAESFATSAIWLENIARPATSASFATARPAALRRDQTISFDAYGAAQRWNGAISALWPLPGKQSRDLHAKILNLIQFLSIDVYHDECVGSSGLRRINKTWSTNPAQPSCARQDARRRCSLQDARRGLRASRRLPYRWRVRWRREQPPSRP